MNESIFPAEGTPSCTIYFTWATGPFDKPRYNLSFKIDEVTVRNSFEELPNDGDTPLDFSDVLEAALKQAYRIVLSEKLTAVHLSRKRLA
jgi:hypothetical protein